MSLLELPGPGSYTGRVMYEDVIMNTQEVFAANRASAFVLFEVSVPEPTTRFAPGLGLAGLGFARKRLH